MASQQATERPKKPRANHARRSKRIRRPSAGHVATSRVRTYETEKAFLDAVVELATLCQWLVYHTYDSRRSQAGFPDLVLVKKKQLIFAELKTNKGRLRPEQREWLDMLGLMADDCTNVGFYLWRPSDWDTIEKLLTGQ